MADKAIEVLLDERRNFPPPKEFKKSAHARSASILNSARKNPQAFWAKAAKELDWFKRGKKFWSGTPLGQVVYRREDQCLV